MKAENSQAIKDAKHIALALPKILTDEIVGAVLALFIFLKKIDKNALIFSESPMPATWKCLDTSLLAKKSSVPPAITVIAIDREKNPIKEISYHNIPSSQFAEIHIVPEKNLLTADDIAIEQKIIPPDIVITVAAKNISSVGSVWKTHPELFYERPIIALNCDSETETLAETTAKLMHEIAPEPLSQPMADGLLFSLYAATNCLKNPGLKPSTILLDAELLQTGADQAKIAACLNSTKSIPLPLLQLLGRACARSKFDAKCNIFWSFITAEDFLKTGATVSALPLITEEMKKIVPMPHIAVFLWQNEITAQKIRAEILISGKKYDKLPGAKLEYASFLEAETELAKLLVNTA